MTEPVIARRCPSCGASIREMAFFCPQCGKELTHPSVKHPQDQVHQSPTEPLHQETAPLIDSTPRTQPRKNAPAVRGMVGEKLQRATTLARDVEGDVVQRVKKVREISGVVLDEAGYDPSLRFVLVAAVLFVLFLVIVLLNRFIT